MAHFKCVPLSGRESTSFLISAWNFAQLYGKIRGSLFIRFSSSILLPSSISMMFRNELINSWGQKMALEEFYGRVWVGGEASHSYLSGIHQVRDLLWHQLPYLCAAVCGHNIKSLSPCNSSMRQGMLLSLLYGWENGSSRRVYDSKLVGPQPDHRFVQRQNPNS